MLKPGVTLYFIRHGETDWNVIQRYQGQTDIPLNDKGRGQAARNGRAMRKVLVKTGPANADPGAACDFVASPLSRTAETMTIVRREIPVAPAERFPTDDRLKEINFGHWEGRLWRELMSEDSEGFADRKADPWGWVPRGGESYQMLSGRVAGWLAGIGRDTLVVSHGGVSRVLRGLVLGLESREIPHLEVPQDKVMVLRDATIAWI